MKAFALVYALNGNGQFSGRVTYEELWSNDFIFAFLAAWIVRCVPEVDCL